MFLSHLEALPPPPPPLPLPCLIGEVRFPLLNQHYIPFHFLALHQKSLQHASPRVSRLKLRRFAACDGSVPEERFQSREVLSLWNGDRALGGKVSERDSGESGIVGGRRRQG